VTKSDAFFIRLISLRVFSTYTAKKYETKIKVKGDFCQMI